MDVDYHSTVNRLSTGAPPALTVPLSQYWYLSHAFRKELSQIENEFGVKINAEASVSVTAVDQIRGDSLNKAFQRVTDLVQNRMKSLQCVKIPHTQVESEIVKEVVRNIRMDRAKMMINMSADQCLLFGPEPVISGVEEQMNLEPGMKLERSSVSSAPGKLETDRELRKAAGNTEEKERVKSKDDDCPICMDKFTDRTKLKCGHEFCTERLEASAKYMGEICPVCKDNFGTVGNQPDGRMDVCICSYSLSGYPLCDTIEIDYYIPDGIQTERHPNPGKCFFGTSRQAYLPYNSEGRHVLKLLRRAFDQRLIFTVGTSKTTGAQNTVIWNGIHHKTSISGGPQNYGYPDPDYLKRVKEDLKAKGIE